MENKIEKKNWFKRKYIAQLIRSLVLKIMTKRSKSKYCKNTNVFKCMCKNVVTC